MQGGNAAFTPSARHGAGRFPSVRGRWWLAPASIAIASRVLSVAIVLGIAAVSGGHARGHNPLAIWDSSWYLDIARSGYHAGVVNGGHDYAFYPAWPMVIRGLSIAFPPDLVAVVAANVLFVLGAVIAWRVLEQRFAAHVATRAIALLSLAPPSFVFSLAYSESLFLVAASLSLVVTSRAWLRPAGAALASLTRIAGLAVIASAAIVAVRTSGVERRTAVTTALAGTLAFAAWWTFVTVLSGDPLGLTRASMAWVHDPALVAIRTMIRAHPVWFAAWAAFVALVAVGTLLLRRDLELFVYAAGVLAIGVLPVISGGILHSVPRYAVIAFPAFAPLADRLGRRGTIALLVVFAVGQVAFAWWAVPAVNTQAP